MRRIRPATSADAVAIAAVHVASWNAGFEDIVPPLDHARRLAVWRDVLAAGHEVVVAESDGEIRGFASWGPSRDEAGNGELYTIYVHPDAWGTGLAQELLETAQAALERYPESTLWTLEASVRGRRFYERMGWRLDATKEDEVGGVQATVVRYRRARMA